MLSFYEVITSFSSMFAVALHDGGEAISVLEAHVPLDLTLNPIAWAASVAGVAEMHSSVLLPSLPRQSWDKNGRANSLKTMQNNLVNGPSHFYIDNDGIEYLRPAGPQASGYYQTMWLTEIINIGLRSTWQDTTVLIEIDHNLMQSNPVPTTTFEEIENVYQILAPHIPVPVGLKDWQLDSSFGADRLTWGGYSLQVERNNTLAISDALATSIAGCSVNQLISEGRLFKVDFSAVGQYSKGNFGVPNPHNQSVPSTYGQFYLTETNQMMPLAVQVMEANAMVYTPQDAPQEWLFAKLCLSTSQSVYYAVEHFSINHMQLEAIRIENLRHVSRGHPVYSLLQHHFTNLFGNSIMGIAILLQSNTELNQVFGSGGVGAAKRIGDRVGSYDFQQQKLINAFENAGTMHTPGFKYRDDILAIRNATYNFAFNYMSKFYKDDADIRADFEIQNWASASAGFVKGFPSSFQTQHDLVDTLTDLIMFVTAQHNVLNGGSTWDSQSFPMSPKAIYGAYPQAKGVVSNAREYLATDPTLIGQDLFLVSEFNIPTLENGLLGHSYGLSGLGLGYGGLISQYQKDLAAVTHTIRTREAGASRPFVNLDPATIPYNCWI